MKNNNISLLQTHGPYTYKRIVTAYISTVITKCTRDVRIFFSRARMQSSNRARVDKSNFTTERKSCSVHMTVFEIVVHRNVDNWIQLLTCCMY